MFKHYKLLVPDKHTCARCGVVFLRKNTSESYCYPCITKKRRAYRKNNKRKLLLYGRKYSITRRVLMTPEERITLNKKTKEMHWSSLKNRLGALMTWTRQNALVRNLSIDIGVDIDWLLALWNKQEGKCAITKLPMIWDRKDSCSVSLDRIDNKEPYTKENLQLVCVWINIGKNHWANEQIVDCINQIRGQKS